MELSVRVIIIAFGLSLSLSSLSSHAQTFSGSLTRVSGDEVGEAGRIIGGLDIPNGDYILSPDSKYVVYRVSTRSELTRLTTQSLYSAPVDGISSPVELMTLTEGNTFERFLITPDSKTVVFSGEVNTDQFSQVFTIPITGGQRRLISPNSVTSSNFRAVPWYIAPDNTVYYWSGSRTTIFGNFRNVPITGGNFTSIGEAEPFGPEELFTQSARISLPFSEISQDEFRLVYTIRTPSTIGPQGRALHTYDLSGECIASIPLVQEFGADREVRENFSISPDQQKVVYVSDQRVSDVFELYSVGIDGGVSTRLNAPLAANRDIETFIFPPLISPDSQTVAYVTQSTPRTSMTLHRVSINGGVAVEIDSNIRELLALTNDFVLYTKVDPNINNITGGARIFKANLQNPQPIVISGDALVRPINDFQLPSRVLRVSSDSETVIFIASGTLFMQSLATNQSPVPLTDLSVPDGSFTFANQDRQVVYITRGGFAETPRIFIQNLPINSGSPVEISVASSGSFFREILPSSLRVSADGTFATFTGTIFNPDVRELYKFPLPPLPPIAPAPVVAAPPFPPLQCIRANNDEFCLPIRTAQGNTAVICL